MSNSGDAAISAASGINNSMIEVSGSKRQNRRAIEFWNMQNEYNHPRQQMQRLQEAGLNPNLVYGGGVSGASGKADALPTPDKPDLSGISKGLTNFLQHKAQKAQVDLLQQQVETERKNTRLRGMQADAQAQDNYNKDYRLLGEAGQASPFAKHTLEGMMFKNAEALSRSMLNEMEIEKLNNVGDYGTQKLINDAIRSKHEASNAEKLGKLRDLEIDLKNKNIDYYDTNQILDIIGKLLGLKNK